MPNPIEIFFMLVVAHFLADYPLQGDFLAKAKNHLAPIPMVPWQHALLAHCSIHAGLVWAVTGLWWLGAMELVSHAMIDWTKCNREISFEQDQYLHLLCKALWAGLYFVAGIITL